MKTKKLTVEEARAIDNAMKQRLLALRAQRKAQLAMKRKKAA